MVCVTLCVLCMMVVVLVARVLYCIRSIHRGQLSKPAPSAKTKTLVVLGSGGHTAEMMSLLRDFNRDRYQPLLYVRASSDTTSEVRIRKLEKDNLHNCEFHTIPRAREVGQSYLTSVGTTLYSLLFSFYLVFTTKPALILTNGPGTCIPLCFSAFLLQVLLFRDCHIIFVESFCRVDSMSLSGKLLYPIASKILVQWPRLTEKWARAQHIPSLF